MSWRRNNFKLAWQVMKTAKARNSLTMFGIVVGVMAAILVVCVGDGIKHQIAGQLGHYGKDVIVVQPSAQNSDANLLTGLKGFSGSLLTQNDLRVVQRTHGIDYAVPLTTTSGSMRGDHTVASPFIVATNADFPQVINHPVQYGGFFDDSEDNRTVVLGADLAEQLFDGGSPLGRTLTWRGQQFIVAGVFGSFAAPPFSLEANFNDAAFVPYSTAQDLSGNMLGLYQIVAKVDNAAHTTQEITAVQQALAAARGGAQDVSVERASKSTGVSDQTIHLLTVLVAGAAIITLIVGGVGIMDVMLVSVTERMHEIGLRKAIGATNRQIMRQFMAEAFVLSTASAIAGLVLSAAAVGLLRAFTSLQPVFVWQIMLAAPLAAILVGLFFGSMPALKAARKDPIDALRQD
jgi:putative ABC transport system permease protein